MAFNLDTLARTANEEDQQIPAQLVLLQMLSEAAMKQDLGDGASVDIVDLQQETDEQRMRQQSIQDQLNALGLGDISRNQRRNFRR